MLFNSLSFFFLLAITLGLFYVLPWRFGRWVLIVASYIFYGAANPWYVFLLLGSTLIDFFIAQWIANVNARKKGRLLLISLVANLGILALFKYADFGISNLNVVLQLMDIPPYPLLEWLLPIGISFYTFQTLSYTIDVYRGKIKPTQDFAAFALFVAYFPQLVAGPIERAGNLLPQLSRKQKVTKSDLEEGFQRILWGLVKKVVIADRLALMVDAVYANPADASAPVLLVATVGFAFQLYLDFSAYTDIAIGIARLMGVRLSENFNWPFLARNPSDLWSRWNITLSLWFRDYVYVSLGGTRRSKPVRTVLSLIFVMTLIGLWHGASWNFIAFGLAAGLSLATYHSLRILLRRKSRGPLFGNQWWSTPVAILLTFIHSLILMMLFRSPDLSTAWSVLWGIFNNDWTWPAIYNTHLYLVIFVMGLHYYRGIFMADRIKISLSPPLRGMVWLGLIILILYGAVDTTVRFIYFQF